jgi:sulfhydrogenase subunit beta (sulfur reductase)
MSYKIMPKSALDDWVQHLEHQFTIVAPKPKHGQFVFGEVKDASEFVLDYPATVLPPKKYLVPTQEELLSYSLDGSHFEMKTEPVPTVILGIHTCDLHGIKLLDRIFSQGFTDTHYKTRRNSLYLVSYECFEPCTEHSFCRSMGTLSATDTFDLHIINLGDDFAFEIGSPKGEALLEGFQSIFNVTEVDIERINTVHQEKWQRFPYRLDFDVTELSELLTNSYTSGYWDELGEICLGCGMCTQVCPTCYCFDIHDEVDLTLDGGHRVRTWDSCQIRMFATVAGGHNFRAEQAARQRHRFMRKGKYQEDAYGLVGCTGCGRCAQACLVDITPVKTFNELYKRRNDIAEKETAEK